MGTWDAALNLPLLLLPLLLLTCLVVLLVSSKKLASLKAGDKILIFGWLFIFIWCFGGAALAALTHRTFFLPPGQILAFGIILFAFATILWVAYRVFRSSLDRQKKNNG